MVVSGLYAIRRRQRPPRGIVTADDRNVGTLPDSSSAGNPSDGSATQETLTMVPRHDVAIHRLWSVEIILARRLGACVEESSTHVELW